MTDQELWLNAKKPEDIWASDPNYPVDEWQYEVAEDSTRLGYWDWVVHSYEAAAGDERISKTVNSSGH